MTQRRTASLHTTSHTSTPPETTSRTPAHSGPSRPPWPAGSLGRCSPEFPPPPRTGPAGRSHGQCCTCPCRYSHTGRVGDASAHRSVFHHAQTRPKVSQTDVTVNVQQDVVRFNVSAGNATSTSMRNKHNNTNTAAQTQHKISSIHQPSSKHSSIHHGFVHLSPLYWFILVCATGIFLLGLIKLIPTSMFQTSRPSGPGTCGCSSAGEWSEWPAPSRPRRT